MLDYDQIKKEFEERRKKFLENYGKIQINDLRKFDENSSPDGIITSDGLLKFAKDNPPNKNNTTIRGFINPIVGEFLEPKDFKDIKFPLSAPRLGKSFNELKKEHITDAFRDTYKYQIKPEGYNQNYNQNPFREQAINSKKPERDGIITEDDILNLKISLENNEI